MDYFATFKSSCLLQDHYAKLAGFHSLPEARAAAESEFRNYKFVYDEADFKALVSRMPEYKKSRLQEIYLEFRS